MVTGPFFEAQDGGLDCILCCPVFKDCDCTIMECVLDYVELIKNMTHEQPTGLLSNEVTFGSILLVGYAQMGTYWRPQIDGNIVNTFGRTLVKADIDKWGTPGTKWRKWFNIILRTVAPELFSTNPLPRLRDKWMQENDCECAEAEKRCDELNCIFQGMREFLEIGNTGNAPWTLEEWERQLCGVCYEDPCTGEDIVRAVA